MPRRAASDDDERPPRRRRGAAAAAIVTERGLVMRILLHSPKDMVAGLLAFTAAGAIVANALFLQRGPHPAPMFGSVVHIPQSNPASVSLLLPRPRPVEADAAEPRLAETRANELRFTDFKATESEIWRSAWKPRQGNDDRLAAVGDSGRVVHVDRAAAFGACSAGAGHRLAPRGCAYSAC